MGNFFISAMETVAKNTQSGFLKAVAMRTMAPQQSLQDLRKAIWISRFEYWSRRMRDRPVIRNTAKLEWQLIKKNIIKNPEQWTLNNAWWATVAGFYLFVQFRIGEALGRGNIWGYEVEGYNNRGLYHASTNYHVVGLQPHLPFAPFMSGDDQLAKIPELTGEQAARFASRSKPRAPAAPAAPAAAKPSAAVQAAPAAAPAAAAPADDGLTGLVSSFGIQL
ncbi:MAG: hypothetical protein MHM6MM_001353 [Cercozoa sp. M6MM]